MDGGEVKRKGLAYAASPNANVTGPADCDEMPDKFFDALNAGYFDAPADPPTKKAKTSSAKDAEGAAKSLLSDAAAAYRPSRGYAAFTQDAALSLEDYLEHTTMWGGRTYHESHAKKRVWQLRCRGGPRVRILAVTGHTPLFALAKIVLEAFQVPKPGGKAYVPALTKGWAPGDSFWSAVRHCPREPWMVSRDHPTEAAGLVGPKMGIYKHAGKGAPFFRDWKKIKVYHLMRRRGDALTYHWPGSPAPACFPIDVRLDGIDLDYDTNDYVRTPRLVGADSLPRYRWTDITTAFIQNKPAECILFRAGLSEAEMNEGVADCYKVPKFDHRGRSMKREREYSGGLEEMHDVVIQPFVECEISSIAKRFAEAAVNEKDSKAKPTKTSEADGGS